MKNSERDHKCVSVFMPNNSYACQILMKPEFLRQIFEKYSNSKFLENSSSVSELFNGVGTSAKSDAILQRNRKISTKFWLGKAKLCSFCARYEGTEGGREI